ncbi:SMI1/KNR4 family protein [Streptomyces sp. NPDC059816]|uniref:SMI1/KNR4 family protein n=1 Tax=Streptomyces sp. NPDC059816 TaxID=3346960 RepID=UPI0036669EED
MHPAETAPTFDELRELLGEPGFTGADPAAWTALERELGLVLPADYRHFLDAYGAILINNQLTLFHPATRWFNLAEAIRDEPERWADVDPEVLPPHPFGTGPGELFPWGHSACGARVYFRLPRDAADPWAVGVIDRVELDYLESPLTFTAWLLAYLRGEDPGLNSEHFAPGRPFFRVLPQPDDPGSG